MSYKPLSAMQIFQALSLANTLLEGNWRVALMRALPDGKFQVNSISFEDTDLVEKALRAYAFASAPLPAERELLQSFIDKWRGDVLALRSQASGDDGNAPQWSRARQLEECIEELQVVLNREGA